MPRELFVTLYDGITPETVEALDGILELENQPSVDKDGVALPELPSMEEIDAEEDEELKAKAGAGAIPPPSAFPTTAPGPGFLSA